MVRNFLYYTSLVLIVACQSDAPGGSALGGNAPFQLECEDTGESEDNPTVSIYGVVEDNRLKLADATGECTSISSSEFAEFAVPDSAITAMYAFWAGTGDYFYVMPSSTGYEVYKGFQDEATADFTYYKIVAYDKDSGRFRFYDVSKYE